MNEDKILDKIENDTRSGKMVWERNDTNKSLDDIDKTGYVYMTSFVDDKIRIYSYKNTNNWNNIECALEVIDSNYIKKFTFSKNRKIVDIYETVKFKTENIQESMEKFLAG